MPRKRTPGNEALTGGAPGKGRPPVRDARDAAGAPAASGPPDTRGTASADGAPGPGDARRRRILEAAAREFAEKGYDRASTNAIAEAAGVAKGLLFHHFGDKRSLYAAAVEEAVEEITRRYRSVVADWPRDLLDRLLAHALWALDLLRTHPVEYRLIADAFLDPASPLPADARERGEAIGAMETERMLREGVDVSRLRPDVPPERLTEMVRFCLEGLRRKHEAALREGTEDAADVARETADEVRQMVDILRRGAFVDPAG